MTPSRPTGRSSLALLLAALLMVATWTLVGSAHAQDEERADDGPRRPRVDVLHVDGPITSVVSAYLERSLANAVESGVDLVVIRLDTPGGSVAVTDDITRGIRSSGVPIVVWVGPSGAMAASAGTFIALAGHVAAMAPETTIGAASPISSDGRDLEETLKRKTVNMMVEQIRNLAERRGPQAQDWAESAVRDAATMNDQEAERMGVIDLIAVDLDNLLSQLEGRQLRVDGRPVVLQTFDADVRQVEMLGIEGVLHELASPDLAYILLTLGLMGLLYEFASPGIGVSGVGGAICLLLGIYSMGVLPANYAGFGLIVVAFGLFFADAKLGTGGLIALGGVVAMVAGGMILFDEPGFAVSPLVIWPTALASGAFFAFAASRVLATSKRPATTGSEAMLGSIGVARSDLAPEGPVVVWGETWRATAEGDHLAAGTAVEVVAVDGLRLRVRAAADAAQNQEEV